MKLSLKIIHISTSDVARINNAISRKIATQVVENMKQQARHSLSHLTGLQYAENLSVGTTRSAETPIYLKGWLPLALERGVRRYDMKPGFMSSPNVKISKKGVRYLVVPIQKGTLYSDVEFKTVTSKSRKRSWIHPGIKAKNFTQKAVEHVRSLYPQSEFIARKRENRGLEDFL